MIAPESRERATGEVRIGFIPLSDVAPLAVAAALGFAEQEGLKLSLLRETSWATLRDRMAVGVIDAAHMLAPMPIAANLGLGPLPMSLIGVMIGSSSTTSRIAIPCSASCTTIRHIITSSPTGSHRREWSRAPTSSWWWCRRR